MLEESCAVEGSENEAHALGIHDVVLEAVEFDDDPTSIAEVDDDQTSIAEVPQVGCMVCTGKDCECSVIKMQNIELSDKVIIGRPRRCHRVFVFVVCLCWLAGLAGISLGYGWGWIRWCELSLGDEMACGPVPVIKHGQDDTNEPDYIVNIEKDASPSAVDALLEGLTKHGIPFEAIGLMDGLIVRLSDEELEWLTSEPRPFDVVQSVEHDTKVWSFEPEDDKGAEEGDDALVNTTSGDATIEEEDIGGAGGRRLHWWSHRRRDHRRRIFWGRRRDTSSRRRWTENPVVSPIVTTLKDCWSSTLWHLDVLDLKQGGKREDFVYRPANTASGVDIYIVDTGVRTTHADFEGRVADIHWELAKGAVHSTSDVHGHGTSMSSAALGRGSGSAKKARLISVQVLRASSSSTSDILNGLDWISRQTCDKCVVSMSLAGGKSTSLNNAVQNLIAKGYPTVVSAGNDAGDACRLSPASVSEALTVGSLGRFGDLSSFSNHGECVDIYAPGESIKTAAWTNSEGNPSDEGMGQTSGTSPATAITAGVAAVYLQAGVPKEKLKEAMLAGASRWGEYPFVHALPPDNVDEIPSSTSPKIWQQNSGETSIRRRYYSWYREVVVSALEDGAVGDTLHCQLTSGKCTWGDCDADLVAQGKYGSRRRRGASWHALAWSRSSTLHEELEVELTEPGPVACKAVPVGNHAEVTVKASLIRAQNSDDDPVSVSQTR